MKILLIGEFSRLHNSLKEGLTALGHEVTIIGNGDGFKNYPVDLSTKAKWCECRIGNIPRQAIYRIFKFDIATIEFGVRFYFHLEKLKGYDVVQLINESSIQTVPFFERYLLKKIISQNTKLFLLSCGVDYTIAKYMVEKKVRYTIMDPYFENHPGAKKEYGFMFDFLSNAHKKTHNLIVQNCEGVIASDMDYALALQGNPKYLGLIPNPVNTDKIQFSANPVEGKVRIFLGVNSGTYHAKGITYFEQALDIIQQKYGDGIELIVSKSLPYNEYIQLFNSAHILLDQVYSFDQGYNALEAMAKGKVVFTGAEKEFADHYKLEQKVAINALPNVDYLVNELSYLIEHPDEITAIGKNARAFIEKEHQYVKIADKYCALWKMAHER